MFSTDTENLENNTLKFPEKQQDNLASVPVSVTEATTEMEKPIKTSTSDIAPNNDNHTSGTTAENNSTKRSSAKELIGTEGKFDIDTTVISEKDTNKDGSTTETEMKEDIDKGEMNADHREKLPLPMDAQDDNDNSSNTNNNNDKMAPTKDDNTDLEIDLTKPLKKGRTAYFIFQNEKRPEVMEEFASSSSETKASVTNVAKRIGQLWANLSTEDKEIYRAKGRKEKELYEKHKLALAEKGIVDTTTTNITVGDASSQKKKNDTQSMIFPVSRIRKICRLDPDVKGLSKESTLLITKTAELFLEKMAQDTLSMAQLHQKRTIYAQDVADICSLKEIFFFLKDDMRDLLKEQKTEKKRKRELKNNDLSSNDTKDGAVEQKKKIKSNEIKGVKPLTSYFTTAKK